MSNEERWLPADGAGGVIWMHYDDNGVATITREAATWLLRRAGFVEADPELDFHVGREVRP